MNIKNLKITSKIRIAIVFCMIVVITGLSVYCLKLEIPSRKLFSKLLAGQGLCISGNEACGDESLGDLPTGFYDLKPNWLNQRNRILAYPNAREETTLFKKKQ